MMIENMNVEAFKDTFLKKSDIDLVEFAKYLEEEFTLLNPVIVKNFNERINTLNIERISLLEEFTRLSNEFDTSRLFLNMHNSLLLAAEAISYFESTVTIYSTGKEELKNMNIYLGRTEMMKEAFISWGGLENAESR